MKVGVAKEAAPGETRVAVVPDTARRLADDGVEVLVERGRRRGGDLLGRRLRGGRRAPRLRRRALRGGRRRLPRPQAVAGRDRRPARGPDPGRAPPAARRRRAGSRARGARSHGLLHGLDPARDARPADGRALLAEHGLRLQGGHARRRAPRQVLPDADDRRGDDPAGEGARARRRRRRPAGDRHRPAARRGRLRLRRAPGGEGAGGEPRRDVPRARRRGRGGSRRLRGRARRGPARARAGADRAARGRVGRGDHDGAHPRPPGARS